VAAEDARTSWREALSLNCPAPCSIPPASIERFLAAVPSVHAGDTGILLFHFRKMEFFMNGRPIGWVGDPSFVRVILATFIGPKPTSVELKRGLLNRTE